MCYPGHRLMRSLLPLPYLLTACHLSSHLILQLCLVLVTSSLDTERQRLSIIVFVMSELVQIFLSLSLSTLLNASFDSAVSDLHFFVTNELIQCSLRKCYPELVSAVYSSADYLHFPCISSQLKCVVLIFQMANMFRFQCVSRVVLSRFSSPCIFKRLFFW